MLKQWMADVDLSPLDLARLLGVSHQAVYQWMSGKSLPSTRKLAKLEEISNGRITARSLVGSHG